MSKVALVTGGSRGIGREIAIALAAAGHRVVVNYAANRDDAAAEGDEVVGAITKAGGEAIAIGADVADPESVEAMFASAAEKMGPVEILVNNAGITRDNLLLRMTVDEFDSVMAVNLRSAFLCTKAALKGMLKAKYGRVISIASVSGIYGNPGQANYAASKAALVGFSKSVAKEVGSRGITVNCIAPGFIESLMTEALPDEAKAAAVANISLGRFGKQQEVAAAVVFLAGDDAGYITGQVLAVDGGIRL